ncbi:hypothetical protein BJ138DRAFT_1112870 [Hygrophoropsis aurantiaca]|uniref:Uncharacterized protein n=1 Tax=Hygrophoropsis aurantiaca TaxID=72124 RepID=A0ACB8AFY3_9AGAM|nr:hypothetical protein BJ138DRAFT_1112870 [Hygrophoropsis aurantiaca]
MQEYQRQVHQADIPAVVSVGHSGSYSNGSPSHQTMIINQLPQSGMQGPIMAFPWPQFNRTKIHSRDSSRTTKASLPSSIGLVNRLQQVLHRFSLTLPSPTHGYEYGDPGIHRRPSSHGYHASTGPPVQVPSIRQHYSDYPSRSLRVCHVPIMSAPSDGGRPRPVDVMRVIQADAPLVHAGHIHQGMGLDGARILIHRADTVTARRTHNRVLHVERRRQSLALRGASPACSRGTTDDTRTCSNNAK